MVIRHRFESIRSRVNTQGLKTLATDHLCLKKRTRYRIESERIPSSVSKSGERNAAACEVSDLELIRWIIAEAQTRYWYRGGNNNTILAIMIT